MIFFSLIIISDDSKDLYDNYKAFIATIETLPLKNYDKSLIEWIVFEDIKLFPVEKRSWPLVLSEDFDQIRSKVESLAKKSSPYTTRSKKAAETIPKSGPVASTSSAVVTVDLSNDAHATGAKEANTTKDGERKKSSENRIQPVDLGQLSELAGKIISSNVKAFALECVKVLTSICKQSEPSDDLPQAGFPMTAGDVFTKIRIIPEKDKTFEKGEFTYLEGTLPLLTKKYKQAMATRSRVSKYNHEPLRVLKKIIVNCFPKHWLIKTTLRGNGENNSLVSIWNWSNPLSNPCDGVYTAGLGEQRVRALYGKSEFYL